MSRQLTISSLFSAFALTALALFARAGDLAEQRVSEPSVLVHAQAPLNFDG